MMADSMVERLARAMEAKRVELIALPLPRCYGELARAAIEAMREPTESMMDAAWAVMPDDVGDVTDRHMRDALMAANRVTLSETESPAPTERESV